MSDTTGPVWTDERIFAELRESVKGKRSVRNGALALLRRVRDEYEVRLRSVESERDYANSAAMELRLALNEVAKERDRLRDELARITGETP